MTDLIGAERNVPPEFDTSRLYDATGKVDLAVATKLLNLLVADGLDEQVKKDAGMIVTAVQQMDASLLVPNQKCDAAERAQIEEQKATDPVGFALEVALAAMILSNMQVERPFNPVSPALEGNPAAELDVVEELQQHFSFMKERQSIGFANTQRAVEAMGGSPNNVNDLRCVVAIPVAGQEEYQHIFRTLEQFTRQSLPTSAFEIVLHINLPHPDWHATDAAPTSLPQTLSEIARFQEAYPDVVVRSFVNAYAGSAPVIGRIRADLWEAVSYDMLQRGLTHDVLVVSSDADIVHINADYLLKMAETFEATGADMVTANLWWQGVAGLPYDAVANKILYYQKFLDHVRDKHAKTLHTADANTGISLATYIAVGGYDRTAELAEMWNLAWAIRDARSKNDEQYEPAKVVEVKSEQSRLKSNSRRLILAMALGRSPYSAWDQKLIPFGANNSLRTDKPLSAEAERMAQLHWRRWIDQMTPYYVRGLPLAHKRRLLKSARKILGFNLVENTVTSGAVPIKHNDKDEL